MERPKDGPNGPRSLEAEVDDILERWAYLAEFLACTHYDGEPPGTRKLGSLLIFAQDRCWKARLVDKQNDRVLWLASSRFLDLLDVCNGAIPNPDSIWRDDRATGAEQARRQNPKKPI